MTNKKNQKTRKKAVHSPAPEVVAPVSTPAVEPTSYDSIQAASVGLGITKIILQKAKGLGCPGFRGSRVYGEEVKAWIEANKDLLDEVTGMNEADLEKRRQEIRKLKMANDHKEGRLVDRSWVLERYQRAAGEINQFRTKSEAEHPMRFAAANGDVAICRTIVRGIWDEIMRVLQEDLSKHLEE